MNRIAEHIMNERTNERMNDRRDPASAGKNEVQ
jgi:hypothetical protein